MSTPCRVFQQRGIFGCVALFNANRVVISMQWCESTGIVSSRRTVEPVGEQADVPSFGAWRTVDEVGNTLERHIRQRRCEFLFRKAHPKQIFGSDDRPQSVANGMHGHEQMVEAVASLHHWMIDVDKIEPGFPLARARRGGYQPMAHHVGRLLDRQLRLKSAPHIRFAGQITGCEGYVESAAIGLMAALMAAGELAGKGWQAPPRTTSLGALLAHITGDAEAETYQPMNVNFGLFPPLPEVRKKQRKQSYTDRAKQDLLVWLPLLSA